MGNWCSNNAQVQEANNQFLFQGEMTDGTSDGRGSKLYSPNPGKLENNKYSNFIRIVKEQAEIISETDFENILSSQFPNLNHIPFPENQTLTPSKNTFILPPIKFPSGEIYKGSWNSNNKREGFGISISSDGNTLFKGKWEKDKVGDYGLFLEKDGDYYMGQLKEGKFEGKGELEIQNVSRYKGEFKNDLPHGKGTIEDFENLYNYDGDWEYGYKHGRGVLEFLDGTKYEGEFKNDLYDGNGVLKFSNGDTYEGEFVEGNIKGKGKFVWNDGKRYDGEYEDFMKNGFGKFYWNDDKFYEGQWLNNKQHGKGLIHNEGTEIEGIFRFGKIIKGN